MITPIVLCRGSSSRLPHKHFKKIGKERIIDIILRKLSENNNVSEIFIATGKKKENYEFEKKINIKKYKKINFYYHKNNDEVTKRVKEVCDLIKDEFSLIISGDCPLIDNKYINRLYKKFSKDSKIKDFIIPNKKTIHEGIFLFRTKSWKLINKLSNTRYLQEHPGSIIFVKKKKFKKSFLKINKVEEKNNLRMSVDTESDLKYLNIILKLKKNKNINFKDLKKYKFLKIINEHVIQRKLKIKYNKKIYIFTKSGKTNIFNKIANIIKREIIETISSNINIFHINKKNSLKKLNLKKEDILIFCLPEKFSNFIKNFHNFKKKIIIKIQKKNFKDYITIYTPSKKNIKCLIKDRTFLENKLINLNAYDVNKLKNFIKKNFMNAGCPTLIKTISKLGNVNV